MSNTYDVSAGVPQGSLLGPVLYNIFVSDVPGPPAGGLLLAYADDILLAFCGPRAVTANARLNAYLDTLSGYFARWKLKLNVGKCSAMLISGRPGTCFPNFWNFTPNLRIAGEQVEVCDKIKYLGVVLDGRFEFRKPSPRQKGYTSDTIDFFVEEGR